MKNRISRREFLKIAGLGGAAAAVLTGCGPASRYVRRQPYSDMPEYALTGKSTYFATTCGECPAGCGLIVRTMEGRAHKVEGNPSHPVNHGKTCSRGQTTLQGLYNPDRIQGPVRQEGRGSGKTSALGWDAVVTAVKDALQNHAPGEIAFLLGLFPDHLADLVQMIATALGGAKVFRYNTLGEFEGRATLAQAASKIFGQASLPVFDLENTDVIFSFGASFLETWFSPVSYAFQYGMMRQGHPGKRGYLVHFEPHMSLTAANADEWFPIPPGTEALLALGLARLAAEIKNSSLPSPLANVSIPEVSQKTGISEFDLKRLAGIFVNAQRQLAIPGSAPLGQTNGLAVAESVLSLNLIADNLGRPGGIFSMPIPPVYPDLSSPVSTFAEIGSLIDGMNSGQIKVLLVHGTNPAYDFPRSLGFQQALQKVPLVISFASFPDETSLQADYVLPDHTPLESWGYQKIQVGSDRATISGLQPVVVPMLNTKGTADVLLSAVQAIGGPVGAAVPFTDEVDFLQQSVAGMNEQGGFYSAPTAEAFWSFWQQFGGWWKEQPGLQKPNAPAGFPPDLSAGNAQFAGDPATHNLHLLPFPSPNLGDGSQANRPYLQETPDPMTTVMWNTWVEINPQTAQSLGVQNDDLVKITSSAGEVEAAVYVYPAILPDVVAIPLGQGHTAFGRFAQGRGANVLNLLSTQRNETGSLAFASILVGISKTGKRQFLARYESREGTASHNP